MTDNYYDILGIAPSADEDAIRAAIRKTRGRYRQVAGSPNKEQARNAEVMIEKLAEAEKRLHDPAERKKYDALLAAQPEPTPDPRPQPATPDGSDAYYWIDSARGYLANGQARNAAQAAKEATRVDPANVEGWMLRAYADLELRDTRDADFSANQAHGLDGRNPQILGLLGDVYDAEERYVEAERVFAHASQLEPANPYWLGRVAWAKGDQGNFPEAIALARQLVAQFPQAQYPKDTLAVQLLRDADASLSQHPQNGGYFTSRKQIAHYASRVQEVKALGHLGQSANGALNDAIAHLEFAKERKFIGQGLVRTVIKYFIGWTFLTWLLAIMFNGFLAFSAVIAASVWMCWRLFNKVYPAHWFLNRKALGGYAKTGLQ